MHVFTVLQFVSAIITLIAGIFDKKRIDIPLAIYVILALTGILYILLVDSALIIFTLILNFVVVIVLIQILDFSGFMRFGVQDIIFLSVLAFSSQPIFINALKIFIPSLPVAFLLTVAFIYIIDKIRRGGISLSSYEFVFYFSFAYFITSIFSVISMRTIYAIVVISSFVTL